MPLKVSNSEKVYFFSFQRNFLIKQMKYVTVPLCYENMAIYL